MTKENVSFVHSRGTNDKRFSDVSVCGFLRWPGLLALPAVRVTSLRTDIEVLPCSVCSSTRRRHEKLLPILKDVPFGQVISRPFHGPFRRGSGGLRQRPD